MRLLKNILSKKSKYMVGLQRKKSRTLSYRMLSVFVLSIMLIALVGQSGLFGFIGDYFEARRRIPQALNSQQELPFDLAADAKTLADKQAKLPKELLDRLSADKSRQLNGEPQDRRHVKTLDDNRTENTITYLNADGSKTQEISMQATSYKDKDGNWKPVDTTLIKNGDSWVTKANSWQASFGPSSEGVQLTKDGQAFSILPVGANTVQPAVTGSAPNQLVTYKNLWKNVDVTYEVTGSQVKESIILKAKDVPTDFRFSTNGVGISSKEGENGVFTLDGAFAGFQFAAAVVMAEDRGVVKEPGVITQTQEGNSIKVSLNPTWLQGQPASAFPIVIDPTITPSSFPGTNAFTASPAGACTASASCPNVIGHDGINNVDYRFGYQVTVPTLPGSRDYLVNAVLHIEMAVPPVGITGSEQVKATRSNCVNGFNCIDMVYGEKTGTVTTSGDIDLVDIYRKAVSSGESNPWILVRGEEGGTVDKYKEFDYTKTKVTFTYETLPAQSTINTSDASITVPPNEGLTVTTQPTLASTNTTSTDPDGPGPQRYRYIIGTSKQTVTNNPLNLIQSVSNVVVDSGTLDQPQWVVPDNRLQDGNTYYWQALVWDGHTTQPTPWVHSPVYSFKVDLRNGKDATQTFDTFGPVSTDFATGNVTMSAATHAMNALGGSLGLGLEYNSPMRSRPGLVGEYWNDPGATRVFPDPNVVVPHVKRVDPNVNFNWGSGTPSSGLINSDNFLTRWSGYFVAPAAATYQFGTSSDDGSRVYVTDMNNPYLNTWNSTSSNLYGAGVALAAGQVVQIKYEFAEWTGSASAQMLVKTTDGTTVTPRVIPTTWLQTGARPIAEPHGLVGRYYTDPGAAHNFPATDEDPTRLFLTRTDTSLSQNWGTGSPAPGGPTENFMVRWTGQFKPPTTDTYKFGVGSDDGARVYINGNLVTNAWSDHAASPIVYGSTVPLTKDVPVNIKVEYYENTLNAQFALYVQKAATGSIDIPVDTNWLLPQAEVLPDGWSLGLDADGQLSYTFAVINPSSVTLYGVTGEAHEWKFENGGFVPPVGETGQMVRNGDGTITLQDVDGQTYVFAPNGTIKSVTKPTDDRNPAALQYTYGTSGTTLARITQITDPVNTNRWLKVFYGGDTVNCPTVPSGGFVAISAHSYICGAVTSDGRSTGFFYTSDANGLRLARITLPGNEFTDYQYTSGMLTAVRSSLANDAIVAGVRSADNTELTTIAYDSLGRASGVTLPAAMAGATRLAHTYEYRPSNAITMMHTTNATEPNGFTRKVQYDGTFRTIADTDVANLTSQTIWHATKDLVLANTTPSGMRSTVLYDYADRPTDSYGPAPTAWFDTNPTSPTYNTPLTSPTNYTSQVPRSQTIYEENVNGLAAAYHEVTVAANGTGSNTKVLFGDPKLHGTGVGPANGDVVRNWGGAPPITPAPGRGWGVSLTGWIHLTATGTYSFRINSDDGVRFLIGDTLVTNDWNDGGLRNHPTNVANGSPNSFVNTGDKWHRVRLDYYNKSVGTVLDTDAQLNLFMTSPGGAETSALGSLLKPNYGLVTTNKVFDGNAAVGDRVVTTNYGTNPELGLIQSVTVDPGGLALTTTNNYETAGASGSFLRQLSEALPGGETTNYAYYGATETRDNPCTTGVTESFGQAGMLKLKTEPDPDGGGAQTPIVSETIYDDAGRIVATRLNTDPWRCTTYDTRSRIAQVVYPTIGSLNGRTVSYDYAVGGNPLVTKKSQSSTSYITTTLDLLGRITKYQDDNNTSVTPTINNYDTIGRLTGRSGKIGTEEYVYDNLNRVTSQKLDTVTLATTTYDAYGRLQQVAFPRAGQQKVVLGRDSLGRVNSKDYTLGDGTTHHIDTVTYSQSNKVVSGTELTKAKAYTYDKLGRLTNATLGTNTYAYSYAAPSAATCNQASANLNAHKSSNRTSQTVNGVTTTYCYNNASRLIASSDLGLNNPVYDAHGNTDTIGQSANASYLDFSYDSSDRTKYIHQVFGGNYIMQYEYDPEDRVVARFESQGPPPALWENFYGFTSPDASPDYEMDNSWNVRERYIKLPGDVLFTVRSSASTFASTSNVYSLPNIHGDTMLTTKGNGTITNTFTYEPFGKTTSTTPPDNANGKADFNYLGQHQKQTEMLLNNQPQMMGARVYMPTMGRFTQVDPVYGGNLNNYTYPNDPVNQVDLDGNWGALIKLLCRVICKEGLKETGKKGLKEEAKQLGKQGAREAGRPLSNAARQLNVAFKTEHAARHLKGTSLTPTRVEASIRESLVRNMSKVRTDRSVSIELQVENYILEYRVMKLADGSLSVGTYYVTSTLHLPNF